MKNHRFRTGILILALLTLPLATLSMAQLSLTTTFSANNNQAGNMFDLVAAPGAAVTVTDLDLNLASGSWDIELYVVTSGGSLVGNEANPAAWSLVATVPGLVSNGLNVPTPMGMPSTFSVAAGQTRGVYVTCSNGTGMQYTSGGVVFGAVAASDSNLQIIVGRGATYPFGTTYTPRLWNGTVHYSLGYALTTTFASNNNQSGNMFDIVAAADVTITGLDLNLAAGTWDIEVYAVTGGGSHVGVENLPGAWTLMATVPGLVSNGADVPTPLSVNPAIQVPIGGTRGIYVTCTSGTGMRYTSGLAAPLGAVVAADATVQILMGRGVVYPFGTTFTPRLWNGTLYYSLSFDDVLQVPAEISTIQGAISAALSGQTVLVAPGTYLESNLDFAGKDIAVIGAGGAAVTIVDAQSGGRGFRFVGGETSAAILQGITILNGLAPNAGGHGGGILVSGASPRIIGCKIQGCHAGPGQAGTAGAGTGNGGPGGPGGNGGGIYVANGAPVVIDCVIEGNAAGNGGSGGTSLFGSMGAGGASGKGGGLYVANGTVSLSGCTLRNNQAGNGAGFNPPTTGGGGGGIFLGGGSLDARSCTIDGNAAGDGGPSALVAPPALGGRGGGVHIAGGMATLASCVLSDNVAGIGADGGGIWTSPAATCVLTSCTIANNDAGGPDPLFLLAPGAGGGVASPGTGTTVVNSIAWSNAPDQILGNPAVTSSDVAGGYPGTGNFSQNPAFVNAANDDYHIQMYSPCIGMADDADPSRPETDIDGLPRVVGPGMDVGADESDCAGLSGTGEDFVLETLVNGAGDPDLCAKVLAPGDFLSVRFLSPTGTFWFEVPILGGQVFLTSGPPLGTLSVFPVVLLPAATIFYDGFTPTPLGPTGLGPGGIALAYKIPAGTSGLTVRFQAYVVSAMSNNGFIAATAGHEIFIQ